MILILKLFINEEKLLFFITNARAFCIHLQICTSIRICRFRGKSVYFSDEVFSLGMPSLCPHLTTVQMKPLQGLFLHRLPQKMFHPNVPKEKADKFCFDVVSWPFSIDILRKCLEFRMWSLQRRLSNRFALIHFFFFFHICKKFDCP